MPPSTACLAPKHASYTPNMATAQLISGMPSYNASYPHQSSFGNLSGGKIAAIIIGTILAVGVVCLLLFCPQLLFAWLMKRRYRDRALGNGEVPLTDFPPQPPGRASGKDRSNNGGNDAASRRRRPEAVHGGNAQPHYNHVIISRPSGSPVVINNNIYIDSNDYLQPLPSLTSPRNRDPAPPVIGVPRNAESAPRIRNFQPGPPPNGGIPPQRKRRGESPEPHLRAPTLEQTSAFWDVADWAHGVASRQAPRSSARATPGSSTQEREQNLTPRREASFIRVRASGVPGAFPENQDVVENFHLVTAPARLHAPRAPSHGDNGFWVREARENRWRRQEQEDRRDRQEREDRRERREREERRERDRHDREERRERDRLEREDRRERQEREERRERQERAERRGWQDEMRG